MAIETLQNLAQVMPTVSTLTTLYTVPASTSVAISSILVCNQNASGSTTANIRMSIGVGGASDTGFPGAQYFCYASLTGQNMISLSTGISLAAGDVLRCYSDQSNVSFTVSGVQVT